MEDFGIFDHVETEGWDLTDEQVSIINKINRHKSILRKNWRCLGITLLLIVCLVIGMCILEEDQTLVYDVYRIIIAFAAIFGFRSLMNFNSSYFEFMILHHSLLKTQPPLPGAPGYVEK